MAVKRDVQYIIKGYDLKTKIKEGVSFQLQFKSHKSLLPMFLFMT